MRCDVAVIGSGPSGIQAAIHAARSKASVVVIGKKINSALNGTKIENYFGCGCTDGSMMIDDSIESAKAFGAEFIDENIVSSSLADRGFILSTESGKEIETKSVIFATGISRKKLNVPGEKELFGKGVSYCASCDCNFYKGKIVTIVGDDTEAANSAALMTRYALTTYWVTDDTIASSKAIDDARSSGANIVKGRVKSISGEQKVTKITLVDGKELQTDGVFIELGAKSSADLAMDLGIMPEMDDTIKVNQNCETDVKGIFACGDITGKPWQLAKAVGQGCIAGMNAAKYVKG